MFFYTLPSSVCPLHITNYVLASAKLKINGERLVLEADGTNVDEADVLEALEKEALILLCPEEEWVSEEDLRNLSFTTISNSSTSETSMMTTSSQSIATVSEETWDNYSVPWHLMDETKLTKLKEGTFTKSTLNEIINTVIFDMRKIKTLIPLSAFKTVAKKIVEKYSNLKDIDDDGCVFGGGYHRICSQLVNRNMYLNRPHKRTSEELHTSKKTKKLTSARAGCSKWAPTSEVDSELIEQKRLELININFCDDWATNEQLYELLDQTYPAQRMLLNKAVLVSEIKEKWPILFKEDVIFWHFKKLTGQSTHLLVDNMKIKYSKMIHYFKISNESDNKMLNILKLISGYFKENLEIIYIHYEVSYFWN